jgi:membrane protein DedA with SNARE-associated domain
VATAIAGCIWAWYAFLAGRLGGKAFENQPVLGFVVAFGGALVISGIVELIRRFIAWRRKRAASPEEPQADQQEDSRRR